MHNGITEIRLKLGDPVDPTEVILRVSSIEGNDNILSYTLDTTTLPNDSITMINGVIDPQSSYPGAGNLPAVATGQRYLLANDVIQNSNWGSLVAFTNDIIEFNGSEWIVSFDASEYTSSAYTTNANTMAKLFFTGSEWVLAVEGTFEQGQWRVVN